MKRPYLSSVVELIKEHRFFFIPFLIFEIIGMGLSFTYPRKDLHLIFNSWSNSFADVAFPFLTTLAEEWITIPIIVGAAFIRLRYFFYILTSYACSSLIVQTLKHTVFSDFKRPFFHFGSDGLQYVEGIHLHSANSMPSGHTCAAFTLFLSLSLLLPRKKWTPLLLFLLAMLVGYSRVYISQHFFHDIVAGAWVGILSPLLFYPVFMQAEPRKAWMNLPIHRVRKN